MARRKNIPVVGANALHIVSLSPEVRKIEARRSKRAAHREYAPVLNADRGAVGIANKEYHSAAQSARGSVGAEDSLLSQLLSGLGGSGLSGKYLQQTKAELTSRKADAASSLPALLAGANEERATKVGEAQQQILSDRAAMQQSAAAKMNARLKELRTAGSSALKEQQTHEASARHEATQNKEAASQEINLAVREAQRLMEAYPEELPTDEHEWAAFTGTVAKADGVGLRAAMAATKLLRKRHTEELHRGLVPQPGVPPPQG